MKPVRPRKISRSRRSAFVAILLSAATVTALVCAELILRACDGPGPGDLPAFFVDTPTYFCYRPDFHYAWMNEDGIPVPIHTDENGFRNPAGYLPGCEAILLGDSYIAGVNTLEDETLAGWLRRKGLKTYNAGVDTYSNGQALQVLKALLPKSKPKIVVLAFYQGNDFHDNYFTRPPKPAASGFRDRMKSAYFTVAAKSLLLRVLHTRLYLGILRGKASDPMASFPLSEMASYRSRYTPAMDEAVARTDSILGEFAAEAKARGFRFLILGIPSKAAVLRSFKETALYEADKRSRDFALETVRQGYSFDKPDSIVQALSLKHGVPYLSLLRLFRKNVDAAPYYRVDTHWRAAGEKIAADALWKALNERGDENEGR